MSARRVGDPEPKQTCRACQRRAKRKRPVWGRTDGCPVCDESKRPSAASARGYTRPAPRIYRHGPCGMCGAVVKVKAGVYGPLVCCGCNTHAEPAPRTPLRLRRGRLAALAMLAAMLEVDS